MIPAFRLRLPCIPIVAPLESSSLSLIEHCFLKPPPIPQVFPPSPIPPPPSQGCYEIKVETETQLSTTFSLEVERTYPKEPETGVCEPTFKITLKVPGGPPPGPSGGGGSNPSGSSESSTTPDQFSCETVDVLVDITCDEDDCTITKYFKTICYISCPCPDVGFNFSGLHVSDEVIA